MNINTEKNGEKCKDIDPTLMYKVLSARMIVKGFIDGEESCNVSVARTAVLESPSQNAIILSGGKHYGQKKKLQLE